ncbi:MAG TPA: 1-(5-phosphoribosyl)-5-[(5-phosphoribosylamino)methylideneamino]imidazole-4-carboxamide isomerase [Candidatus Marinimicrobia bacterium]|nr:1-(5-phosphoribosyl)-5-[(5-phosphoribosylamino)methylideneamino]imidazole-4-carboxamide isomerase [Candidatus Neomarinimicrobiota bacterium]HRS52467.1 1-(5-phosphoribosyl)-5-[(5-phosphoribosylamino)methylideneamino]imidazole-4-carboxamide isomerase [Candidatus Neomarinimicrobiota bacterium]HRU92418.1 1-(5-phosphoribosyl)-5-[(5-phosphoribosylamino)methylideneamino]imidazole-4-carboxamide isomerase [Candidatus Neomarinimicrobiota bacterium]
MITIIPAIDILNGKCVRLSQGDFDTQKIYNENPLEVARQFADAGIKRLHLVDLDGARQKRVVNWKVLENIATETPLQIDFGGGIRSESDVRMAFASGARQVTVGSIAVTAPDLVVEWLKKFGSEKIILGADVIDRKIVIHGWQEKAPLELMEFLQNFREKGVQQTICTEVARDGMLIGPAFELYREIKQKLPDLYLIASGGVSQIDDIYQLQNDGIDGVIIGKALYEGNLKLSELKGFLC